MSTFDFSDSSIFDSGIRSLREDGMVMLSSSRTAAVSMVNSSVKVVRSAGLALAFIAGFNACSTVQALEQPHQRVLVDSQSALLTLLDPTSAETMHTWKNDVLDALKSIASLGENWQREDALPPVRQALVAAEQLVPLLPNAIPEATVGIDGDGYAYFKLRNGEIFAYLTVEPSIMHLVVLTPDQNNVYLDNVRFHPRVIPSKVLKALEERMVG